MTEAGYLRFHNIIAVVGVLLYAVGMSAFLRPFLIGKEGAGKGMCKKLPVIMLVYALACLIGIQVSVSGWLRMLAVVVLLMSWSSFLGIDKALVFFLGEIFFCIRNQCVMVGISANILLDRYFMQGADTPGEVFFNAAVKYALVDIFQFTLFSVMLYTVSRQLRKREMELHIKELCCLLLVPVTGILFVNTIVRLMVVVRDDVVFMLYEQFPELLWIMPVAAVLFYGGILITIALYQKMMGFHEEKEKYFVQEQQIRALQERMEDMERLYEGIRRMKHEMKNHLTNIKGLVQNGCYGDMEQYIARMDESMDILEFAVKTGNAVTDVILNDKRKTAEKFGIQFRTEFSWPASEGYDSYDMGIILNNLLTNALEACRRMTGGERYISLSGRQKKKFFLIEVRNSYEGEIILDKKTNLPVSTKKRELSGKFSPHGIGLSNVRREVEKYMGDMEIAVKGNEFCVTVILQEIPCHPPSGPGVCPGGKGTEGCWRDRGVKGGDGKITGSDS